MGKHRPRIYFAGPDVFRKDAAEHFKEMVRLCERLGMVALIPADTLAPTADPSLTIYQNNLALLKRAHALICNLQDFRGLEPDSGTAFEVGFAAARKIHIVGYGVPHDSYLARIKAKGEISPDLSTSTTPRDWDGYAVEDYGHSLNLMIHHAAKPFQQDASRALQFLASFLV